ncbi:hypothetical protein [Bacillus sp. FJAT-47783]|uniref:hypothetical protein n=1 Tax=Bacillus sp. FJAT-47783 TaxID=2922712 RepID=UPI001FABA129|nr:hypothetical protein [Bacillus sp. FJAT-47783]
MKNILLIVAILSQITGYFFLFIHVFTGVTFIVISFLAFISIIIFLIKERVHEKKEENENDYRNY